MLAPATPTLAPPSRRASRAGLAATLDLAPGLRQFWHPVAFSDDVKAGGAAIEFDLFDESWRLVRPRSGGPPTLVAAAGAARPPHQAAALPTSEADGFVWAWPGVGEPPSELPSFGAPPPGYTVHAQLTLDVPVDVGLLLENLLDLAHAPFTHTSTFARGWPVPDAVKFKAAATLSGVWDPYPIDMAHAPPTGVLSRIGLVQPGAVDRRGGSAADCPRHLHQLHAVLPAGRGRVRLLYRMCLDFWPWAARLPFATTLWSHVAGKVLGEDLVLVAGQQDRLARGGDAWGAPAPYDKLAVRARRWRNAVAAAGGAVEESGGSDSGEIVAMMSSGELLFGADESE